MLKSRKTQSEETGQTSVPDQDIAHISEWQDQKCKLTILNMLKALMKKVDHMQEQMGSINKNMEILRNHQNKILEIKKIHYDRNRECLWWAHH